MAEHITEEEQIAAIKSWWQDNGSSILLSVGAVLIAYTGWTWYQNAERDKAEAASLVFSEYIESRSNADSDDALLADLEKNFPDSGYEALALFYQAADAIEAKDLDAAIVSLKLVQKQSSNDLLSSLAILRLAKIQHEQGLSDDALAALAGVKGDGFVSLAAELKGDILLSRGEAKLALEAYEIAKEKAGANAQRPLLEMKLADLAIND